MLSQHKDEQIAVAGMRLRTAKQEHIDAADDLYRASCAVLRNEHDDNAVLNLQNATNRFNSRRQALTLAELEYSRSGEPKSEKLAVFDAQQHSNPVKPPASMPLFSEEEITAAAGAVNECARKACEVEDPGTVNFIIQPVRELLQKISGMTEVNR